MLMKSSRVAIRALEDKDLSIYHKIVNDKEIRAAAFLDSGAPVSEKMCMELFTEWTIGTDNHKTDYWFAIDSLDSDQTIGIAGIYQIDYINGRALGPLVMLDPAAQGNGFGTEAMVLLIDFAFGNLRLHRLFSEVKSFNQRQIRLREKIGYVREGVQREASYVKGQYYDVVSFGLLATDWRKAKETTCVNA